MYFIGELFGYVKSFNKCVRDEKEKTIQLETNSSLNCKFDCYYYVYWFRLHSRFKNRVEDRTYCGFYFVGDYDVYSRTK